MHDCNNVIDHCISKDYTHIQAVGGRRYGSNNGGLGAASQWILQQTGELTLSVGDVGGMFH